MKSNNCANCKWYLWYEGVCSNPKGPIAECVGPGNRCDAWEEQQTN